MYQGIIVLILVVLIVAVVAVVLMLVLIVSPDTRGSYSLYTGPSDTLRHPSTELLCQSKANMIRIKRVERSWVRHSHTRYEYL